ncbi:MAG: cysteine protease StiP family protein [Granulosicoccus sp.]
MQSSSDKISTSKSKREKIGTYDDNDITFLLSPLSETEIQQLYKDPAEKERLIQQGIAHYSQMLTQERKPDERYLSIFEQALARFGKRMGHDIAYIAVELDKRITGPITLLSLVRAGAPIGVLLHRALKVLGRESNHYGVSIIRDKGIDINAMKYVLQQHSACSVLFVDGWTGKGAISNELETSMAEHPEFGVEPRMITLADPAGRAWLSASSEDWLIPSGILGSTVSGLISRSVLRKNYEQSSEYHATAQLHELKDYDLSRRFVDTIHQYVFDALPGIAGQASGQETDIESREIDMAVQANHVIANIADEFRIENMNRIKPGIAEATRAVLRRLPDRVIVSSAEDDDLAALVHLARQAGVSIEERGLDILPYRAITIIAHRGNSGDQN